MTAKIRILFVDDEPAIRMTLPAILKMHGFEVTVAASVPEALAIINSERFDVLLSDLNIGQPGDGFVVVSAMRRTQPDAVTMIITGYPAFETALQAIREQVDDYFTKPAEIEKLVEKIQQKVLNRQPRRISSLKRVPVILRENQGVIMQQWLDDILASAEITPSRLSKARWVEDFPKLFAAIVETSEMRESQLRQESANLAYARGERRRSEGFSAAMLAEETRLGLRAIGLTVQNHLLEIDVSQLIPDLLAVADSLSLLLRESLRALSGLSQYQTA